MNLVWHRDYNSYSMIILMVIIFGVILFSISLRICLHQTAIGKNSTNTTNNAATTGKDASQNAESLVRSIMDPSSLMSSVINETGGTKNQSSSESAKILSSNDNNNANQTTTTPPQVTTKNNNITTSSSPDSPAPTPSVKVRNLTENEAIRNIDTLLLAHQIIPPKDFLHLYDTDPYNIVDGHVAAKIPCDANSSASLQMLVGHLPRLRQVQLEPIKELSKPGYLCMYEGNIGSSVTSNSSSVTKGKIMFNTDLVLLNPTDYRIILPNTSTVVISVSQGHP